MTCVLRVFVMLLLAGSSLCRADRIDTPALNDVATMDGVARPLDTTPKTATGGAKTPNTTVFFFAMQVSQTITFTPLADKVFGDAPFAVTASADSGLPVSFAVSGPAVFEDNTLTLTGAGEVTITVSQAGDENYFPATDVVQTFSVAKGSQSISLTPLADKVFGDAPFTVTATADSGLPVALAISGSATLDGNTVTLTRAGAVTITASQAGNENFEAAGDVVQTIDVARASQSVTFAPLADKVFGDAPFTVSASADTGLPVTFAVSGPATLEGGTLTLHGAGTVTLTASQAGDENHAAATVVQTFAVAKASQTVSFAAIADKVFGDAPFTVTASASTGRPVTIRVQSGPATIAGTLVTLSGAGTVTLTADQVDDPNFAAASASLAFSVRANAAPILLSIPSATQTVVAINESVSFSATGSDADGDPITLQWNFADGATATGPVVSHAFSAPGTFVVSVLVSDGHLSSTAQTVTVVVSAQAAGSIAKLKSSFKLVFSGAKDTFSLSGGITLQAGAAPKGRSASVQLDAVSLGSFTLDDKLSSTSPDKNTVFKLSAKVDKKTGDLTSTSASFLLSLKKQNVRDRLAALGFVSTGGTKQVPVSIRVQIDSSISIAAKTYTYSAKEGLSGAGK